MRDASRPLLRNPEAQKITDDGVRGTLTQANLNKVNKDNGHGNSDHRS